MIKTIIFDNNGVLVTSNEETGFKAIAKELDVDITELAPIYDSLGEKLDEGKITHIDFFRRLIDRFDADMSPDELKKIIYDSFVRKEDTIDFVLDIRKKYEIALLTNFGDAFRELDKRWKITSLFDKDKVFLSCEMETRKPLKGIYLQALESLNRKPSETIFVDDKLENVEAARKVGMKGIVFKNVDSLKQELQKYITI